MDGYGERGSPGRSAWCCCSVSVAVPVPTEKTSLVFSNIKILGYSFPRTLAHILCCKSLKVLPVAFSIMGVNIHVL